MVLDRARLLRYLHERGMVGVAERVESDLPERIDTEEWGARLDDLGIDVTQLQRAAAG